MHGYLSMNKADKKHMDISHYQNDLLMEMQILKQACKQEVKKVYYSKEKRDYYNSIIDQKMTPPEGILGYMTLSYGELKASYKNYVRTAIYTLNSMKQSYPSVSEYYDRLLSIFKIRDYAFQNIKE